MSNESEFTVKKIRHKIVIDTTQWLENLDEHGALFDLVLAAIPADVILAADANYYFRLSTTGDRHALAAVIRALRVNGFKTSDDKKPKDNEPSFHADYRHESGAWISLGFTSKVCTRIKVGTKMVEQDVYETVCDEFVPPVLSLVKP